MRLTIRTYEELDKYARAFSKGAYNLFFLIGSPGLSKSTMFRRMQSGDYLWVEGSVSAFKLYMNLWDNRHKPVIMDDVDSVYTDRALVRLLKCLCQTEETKVVSWNTSARQLDALEIPNEFSTRSKTCIIANEWHSLNKHVGSLADRGLMVHFKPSPQEVHKKALEFVKDKEITDFFAGYLNCVDELSLRMYITCAGLKKQGLDWQTPALETMDLRDVAVYAKLTHDKKFPLGEQRALEFMRLTGQSRPMYFMAQKRYKDLADLLPKPKVVAKKNTAKPAKKRALALV